jgi:predicted lipoprotein with Yx(FWY)xxD motif
MGRFRVAAVAAPATVVVVGLLLILVPAADPASNGWRAGESPQYPRMVAAAAPTRDPEDVPRPPVAVVAASGALLVDGAGRALYVFSLDPPGQSRCMGPCAVAWPPARSLGGKPQPGAGVAAPAIGNVQRADGSEQMTLDGHPLYYYGGDGASGQRNGEGRDEFGGRFTAGRPS